MYKNTIQFKLSTRNVYHTITGPSELPPLLQTEFDRIKGRILIFTFTKYSITITKKITIITSIEPKFDVFCKNQECKIVFVLICRTDRTIPVLLFSFTNEEIMDLSCILLFAL